MAKRAWGDPRDIRVAHITCGTCGHEVRRLAGNWKERDLPELRTRLKCGRCHTYSARVSLIWHKWPDERWLRDLAPLPPME